MDGWNTEALSNLVTALSEANNLLYEIENCVRGCHSGAHTYAELKEYAEKVARMIQYGAEDCDCISDDEEMEEEW